MLTGKYGIGVDACKRFGAEAASRGDVSLWLALLPLWLLLVNDDDTSGIALGDIGGDANDACEPPPTAAASCPHVAHLSQCANRQDAQRQRAHRRSANVVPHLDHQQPQANG